MGRRLDIDRGGGGRRDVIRSGQPAPAPTAPVAPAQRAQVPPVRPEGAIALQAALGALQGVSGLLEGVQQGQREQALIEAQSAGLVLAERAAETGSPLALTAGETTIQQATNQAALNAFPQRVANGLRLQLLDLGVEADQQENPGAFFAAESEAAIRQAVDILPEGQRLAVQQAGQVMQLQQAERIRGEQQDLTNQQTLNTHEQTIQLGLESIRASSVASTDLRDAGIAIQLVQAELFAAVDAQIELRDALGQPTAQLVQRRAVMKAGIAERIVLDELQRQVSAILPNEGELAVDFAVRLKTTSTEAIPGILDQAEGFGLTTPQDRVSLTDAMDRAGDAVSSQHMDALATQASAEATALERRKAAWRDRARAGDTTVQAEVDAQVGHGISAGERDAILSPLEQDAARKRLLAGQRQVYHSGAPLNGFNSDQRDAFNAVYDADVSPQVAQLRASGQDAEAASLIVSQIRQHDMLPDAVQEDLQIPMRRQNPEATEWAARLFQTINDDPDLRPVLDDVPVANLQYMATFADMQAAGLPPEEAFTATREAMQAVSPDDRTFFARDYDQNRIQNKRFEAPGGNLRHMRQLFDTEFTPFFLPEAEGAVVIRYNRLVREQYIQTRGDIDRARRVADQQISRRFRASKVGTGGARRVVEFAVESVMTPTGANLRQARKIANADLIKVVQEEIKTQPNYYRQFFADAGVKESAIAKGKNIIVQYIPGSERGRAHPVSGTPVPMYSLLLESKTGAPVPLGIVWTPPIEEFANAPR